MEAEIKDNLLVMSGKVGNENEAVLPDSGCNRMIVKRDLVDEVDLTGEAGHMLTVYRAIKRVLTVYRAIILENATSFCRSCDVCQKTVPRNSVPRALVRDMLLIDQPFKRFAINLWVPSRQLMTRNI